MGAVIELALKMKNVIQAKAKEKQGTSTGGSKPQLSQKSDEAEPMRTDEELSKLAGFNLGGLVNQIYSGICAFCAHSKLVCWLPLGTPFYRNLWGVPFWKPPCRWGRFNRGD